MISEPNCQICHKNTSQIWRNLSDLQSIVKYLCENGLETMRFYDKLYQLQSMETNVKQLVPKSQNWTCVNTRNAFAGVI